MFSAWAKGKKGPQIPLKVKRDHCLWFWTKDRSCAVEWLSPYTNVFVTKIYMY